MFMICVTYCLVFVSILPGSQSQSEAPQLNKEPENTTSTVHSNVKIKCIAQGSPKPTITWTFNGHPLQRTNVIKVQKVGHLRILNASTDHVGWYSCQAKNKHGFVVSAAAYLEIQVPVEFQSFPLNKTVDWGSQVTINCTVIGKPQPYISWKKDKKPLIDPNTLKIFTGNQLTLNVTENATYTCIAENILHDKVYTKFQVSQFSYFENTRSKGYCSTFEPETSDSICHRYKISKHLVFLNTSYSNAIKSNEDLLNYIFKNFLLNFKEKCRESLQKLLCESVYPDCQDSVEENVAPFPICRSSCEEVRDVHCPNDWDSFLSHVPHINNQNQTNRWAYLKPLDCDRLPTQQCVHLQESSATTDSCYKGKGVDYAGTMNITETGYECIIWDKYPHNYCRNPGGLKKGPWCYIQKKGDWQYCSIPKCPKVSMPEPRHLKEKENLGKVTPFVFHIIIGTSSAVFFLLVITAVIFSYRLCQRHRRYSDYLKPLQHEMGQNITINVDKLTKNSFYHQRLPSSSSSVTLEILEFARNDILFLEDIAQGAFGKLFKARANCLDRGHFKDRQIAVKMLWENASEYSEECLRREAELMCELDHPNILRLLGVCLQDHPLCLIYEYMSEGDMTEFLRRHSPQYFKVSDDPNKDSGHVRHLNHIEQLDLAIQVASGMLYLSSKGNIHRDLASRNCLVGDHLSVKISDFALMRFTDSDSNYFQGEDFDPVPIRWMAPEAIFSSKFSTASDVWSYGVLMWEIFSFAMEPYYEQATHEDAIRYIKQGNILNCPENTPEEIYEVMKMCWSECPKERPKFSSLYYKLSSLRQQYKYASINFDNEMSDKSAIWDGNSV